jgi:hypothetical protein
MTLVEQFENATLPLAEFHHAQHLEVALWYTLHYPPGEACTRMSDGLRHYLAANHIPAGKYSQAVTDAWMARIAGFVATADRTRPFPDLLFALRAEVAALPPKLGTPESATIEAKPQGA